VEAGIFAWERLEELADRAEREAQGYELTRAISPVTTDKDRYEEARSKVRRMRGEQEDELATLGRTFARDADRANAFSKLSRYEIAIGRQLYRALHELERRQAARGGAAVTPPQVLDVEVSGMPEETGS